MEIKRVLKTNGTAIVLEEEFFEGIAPKPAFAKDRNYLAKLAELENYVGTQHIKNLFRKHGFKLEKQKSLPVDSFHKTVGMVFKKTS